MSEETVSTEAITEEEIEEILQETSESIEEDSEESLEEDASEESSDDEEELEEARLPKSKPAMVRAIFNQLQDTKKAKLESHYDKIMQSLTDLDEDLEEADDPNVAKPDEIAKSVKKAEGGTSKALPADPGHHNLIDPEGCDG